VKLNKCITFFCKVHICLHLKFVFSYILYADRCFVSDKKVFQGNWYSCWCKIHWSNVHDPCNSGKCIRWNSMHCTWTKCCESHSLCVIFFLYIFAIKADRFEFWSCASYVTCVFMLFSIWYWFTDSALQVHGAFAGYSGITVGLCNTHYAYFPIPEVISHPRLVDPNSRMWHRCLTSTGQPDFI